MTDHALEAAGSESSLAPGWTAEHPVAVPPASTGDERPLLPGPSEAVIRSLAAYRRDLPALLETDYRRWVAYADGERVGIAKTQTELYRHCLNVMGLDHDRFIVACIVPDEGEIELFPR